MSRLLDAVRYYPWRSEADLIRWRDRGWWPWSEDDWRKNALGQWALRSEEGKMTPIDPKVVAFLAAFRMLLIVIGTVLADNHFGNTELYHIVMGTAGATMALGMAMWALYSTFMSLVKSRAVGVQAGINLVSSGRALDESGNSIAPTAAQPKQVTLATAAQIVRNFGPDASEIPRA